MSRLSASTLTTLGPSVWTPRYDRARCGAGIVHLGRRRLPPLAPGDVRRPAAERGQARGLGHLRRRRAAGRPPDGGRAWRPRTASTPLVVKHPDGRLDARVVGSIVEYLFAPDDPEAVVERMAAPATRIVSLTITEGGYNTSTRSPASSTPTDADVRADLRPGAAPRTVVRAGRRGPGPAPRPRPPAVHGHLLRQRPAQRRHGPPRFAAFAALRDPELGEWVAAAVRLPQLHGRPDHPGHHRRRPRRAGPPVRGRGRLAGGLRAVDQWVLEDDFPGGRPPWRTSACSWSPTSHPTS